MFKKITILTITLLLTLGSFVVAAKPLPTSLEKPVNLTVREDTGLLITKWTHPESIIQIAKDLESSEYQVELGDSADLYYLIDWKKNDGEWNICPPPKNPNFTDEINQYFYMRVINKIMDEKGSSEESFPIWKLERDKDASNKFDLKNNTYYFRMRYALESYDKRFTTVYSPYSDVFAIGKDANKTSSENPKPSTGGSAESFDSGARIVWNSSNGLGYRLFRSTSSNDLGISVTDFYITSTSYADVNIEPNTTYYYTVKPVLSEARPLEGVEERLGDDIAKFTVTTGNQIYKPGNFKHFIMLKLDNPNMSVDGINQEIDPGRGTKPLTIGGRTMVPIRAIVESTGGTVDWDGSTQKITLKARGNTVEMWMNKKDIKVNGISKKMDVAPVSKNDRTFVPVRFSAENLNIKVDWINSTKEAILVYEE